ncbi:ubiquinol-cytochrome c reductase binding protein-like protein [Sarcoptes scabiei]|nr:ubiquinol-cytochrome c reductase binding protein-like protein [Sarcoptes scabiei]
MVLVGDISKNDFHFNQYLNNNNNLNRKINKYFNISSVLINKKKNPARKKMDRRQSKKKISIERVECFKRMIGTNKKIVTKLVDFFRYLKRKLDKILSDERNLKLSFCFLIRKILFACNVFFLNSFHFGSKCFGSFRL